MFELSELLLTCGLAKGVELGLRIGKKFRWRVLVDWESSVSLVHRSCKSARELTELHDFTCLEVDNLIEMDNRPKSMRNDEKNRVSEDFIHHGSNLRERNDTISGAQ